MRKILTVGVYDLLHVGHVELFRKAKQYGDYLIVAVQDSKVVLKYKPEAKLVYSTEERIYMVNAIKHVNEVVIYSSVDNIVKEVDFDIFIVGPDQNHSGFQQAIKWCKDNNKEVVVLPRTEGISSSSLKNIVYQQYQKK